MLGYSGEMDNPPIHWGPVVVCEPYQGRTHYYQRIECGEGEVLVRIVNNWKIREPSLWLAGTPFEVKTELAKLIQENEGNKTRPYPTYLRHWKKWLNTIENALFRGGYDYDGREEEKENQDE